MTTENTAPVMKNEDRELTLCTFHFAENDDRFNGRRTCIYVGKGPKYISLIVMDAAELTITRVSTEQEAALKFLTSEQADPAKALETFRAMARQVGCTKPVAEALGIEWPPVRSEADAQAAFEARAQERGMQVQRETREEERERKAAEKQQARELRKARAEEKERERLAAIEAAKAKRAAKAPRAPKAPSEPKGEGKIAVIRRVMRAKADILFGADTKLADLDRSQSARLIEVLIAELADANPATIRTQYSRVRSEEKSAA